MVVCAGELERTNRGKYRVSTTYASHKVLAVRAYIHTSDASHATSRIPIAHRTGCCVGVRLGNRRSVVVRRVVNQHIVLGLVPGNISLSPQVVRHISMHIQVVGLDMHHHSNMRAPLGVPQLETTQLIHHNIARLNMRQLRQTRHTNITHQVHRIASRPQNTSNKTTGCPLTLTPRHTNDWRWAAGKELIGA